METKTETKFTFTLNEREAFFLSLILNHVALPCPPENEFDLFVDRIRGALMYELPKDFKFVGVRRDCLVFAPKEQA